MERRPLILAIVSAILFLTVLSVRGGETEEVQADMDLLMRITRTENPAERLPLLERFVKEFPEHPYRDQVQLLQGRTLAELEREDEAIRVIEDLLRRNPTQDTKVLLAELLLEADQKPDRAESLLREALAEARPFDPQNKPIPEMSTEEWQEFHRQQLGAILALLAEAQEKLGKKAEAETSIREALELTGDVGGAATLAGLLQEKGETAEAFRVLDDALRREASEDPGVLARHRSLFQTTKGGGEEAYTAHLRTLDQARADARKAALRKELIARPAPEFAAELLDGSKITLESYQGKPLVLNFWATWCAPCRAELPHFQAAYEALRNDGVAFLAVSTDQGPGVAQVRPFLAKGKYTFPVAVAPTVGQAFGVRAIPYMAILDGQGKIRYELRGYDPRRDLEEILTTVTALLREGAPARAE